MSSVVSKGPITIDRGGSQSDLRRFNERIVLSALDRHPGLFNAELARRTGLAAQTISVILRALEAQGLIARGAVLRGRRGQPATPLHLKSDGAYGIGAALCWRRLTVCMTDFSGAVRDEDDLRHPHPDFNETIERIAAAVGRFLGSLPRDKRRRVAGLGLALPAAIDRYLAALDAPPEAVRAWAERDFCAELSSAIGMEVSPVSYGSAASGAEIRETDDASGGEFAYFFLGTLLLGGVVSGNSGFATAADKGTMLGAMLVPGAAGSSLRADTLVSASGLQAALGKAGVSDPGCIGPRWDWQGYAPVVEAWLDAAAPALAHVIVNTQCAFDIEAVVVDGLLPRDLIAALIARLDPALVGLPVAAGRLPVLKQGQLGLRAAMLGAARVPLQQRFFNTDPLP